MVQQCLFSRSFVLHVNLLCDSSYVGVQASNVATYIAHGDVALSVLMTTASTLGAIIMTPLLTKTLAGTLVPVDAKVILLYADTHLCVQGDCKYNI